MKDDVQTSQKQQGAQADCTESAPALPWRLPAHQLRNKWGDSDVECWEQGKQEKADAQLLKLAAKAIGDEVAHFRNDGSAYLWGMNRYWNPLTDDADAFRLAVQMDLQVTPYPVYDNPKHSVIAARLAWDSDAQRSAQTTQVIEAYMPQGREAATRRAIVRAAAAIWSQQ